MPLWRTRMPRCGVFSKPPSSYQIASVSSCVPFPVQVSICLIRPLRFNRLHTCADVHARQCRCKRKPKFIKTCMCMHACAHIPTYLFTFLLTCSCTSSRFFSLACSSARPFAHSPRLLAHSLSPSLCLTDSFAMLPRPQWSTGIRRSHLEHMCEKLCRSVVSNVQCPSCFLSCRKPAAQTGWSPMAGAWAMSCGRKWCLDPHIPHIPHIPHCWRSLLWFGAVRG